MIKFYFFILFALYSETINAASREYNLTNATASNPISYNIPDAVQDTNVSKWNNTNWTEHMTSGNGYGSIGNTMMMMNENLFLKKGLSSNPNDMTIEALQADVNATPAVLGFDESFKNSLIGATTTNSVYSPNTTAGVLECFIARDLPFRYKCEETGLVYGGATLATTINGAVSNMDGMSGKDALNLCKSNCKQQLTCVDVNYGSISASTIASGDFSFESNSTYSVDYNNSYPDNQTDFISLDINITKDDNQSGLMEISYVNREDINISFISNYSITSLNTTKEIPLRDYVKKLSISFYTKADGNATISGVFTEAKLHYQVNNKYICPALQNIDQNSISTFGDVCPNGTITDIDGFLICSNGIMHGDNTDGSFSDFSSCHNECNIAKKCAIEVGTFDANIFDQIREGELGIVSAEGTFTSSTSTITEGAAKCTAARNSNEQIVNESVFDAQHVPYNTVLNGVLVPDVRRPRVMQDSSNLSYEQQKKEEWKDGAYSNMISSGRYSMSPIAIGEDTNSSFAYSMSITNGVDYGTLNSNFKREFQWNLKPDSLSYSNDIYYRLYAVIKVDVEKYGNTINGYTSYRDQIWYIKTSESDTFIPFVKAENYATAQPVDIGTGEIYPTVVKNRSASYNAQSFDTSSSSWNTISYSASAPSFKSTRFIADDFWYTFKIFDSIGDVIYKLPGLVRHSSVGYGGAITNYYSGDFDGTGDGMVGYQIYTFFSQDVLTYQDIKNKVDAIDNSGKNQLDKYGAKIYQSTSSQFFDKFISPDNVDTDNNINIYQYGPASKYSLKVSIKPKAEDIGKNAFIFIFMY